MNRKLTVVVTIFGLLVGAGMIGTACFVWVSSDRFGVPGALLVALGTVLIGLSVWKKVAVEAGSVSIVFEKINDAELKKLNALVFICGVSSTLLLLLFQYVPLSGPVSTEPRLSAEAESPSTEMVEPQVSGPSKVDGPQTGAAPAVPPDSVTMLEIVPGRVGIAILNSSTQVSDPAVSAAVLAILREESTGVDVSLLALGSALVEKLMLGDSSALTKDGRSPNGAELVIVGTSNLSEVPVGNPRLTAVQLSLKTWVFSAATGQLILRTADTHTGLGATSQEAVAQAVERCITEIVDVIPRERSGDDHDL